MFGDTIEVGFDGIPVVALTKINQDGYSSEYLFRDTLTELRLKIRHSKESLKPGQSKAVERHNCLFSVTKFATSTTPELYADLSYTLRASPGLPIAQLPHIAASFSGWLGTSTVLTGKVNNLANWVS